MKYTVRFRGGGGEETLEVEAAGRAEVFRELKRRGIRGTVLGVSETSAPGAAKGGARRAALARPLAVLAALLALAAVLRVWRARERGAVERTPAPAPASAPAPSAPAPSAPQPAPPASRAPAGTPAAKAGAGAPATQPAPPAARAPAETTAAKAGDAVPPGHIKLPTGQVLKYRLPPEGSVRRLVANGEIFEVYPDGAVTNVSPKPLFEKPFERTLAVLAYPDDGILMMEDVKKMKREEILKWCREPTGYYDDDTEEDLQKRKTVAEMKAAVLEYLEGGGNFADYAEEVRNFNREELSFHAAGLHEITSAVREGRLDDARAYLKGVNDLAKENGYRPLMLPARYRALLEGKEEM